MSQVPSTFVFKWPNGNCFMADIVDPIQFISVMFNNAEES